MTMLDDRVCPSCQVLLPAGRTICPKCGRKVEPEKTNIGFIDIPRKLYSSLVDQFGPVGASVIAGLAFLILVGIFLALIFWKALYRTQ